MNSPGGTWMLGMPQPAMDEEPAQDLLVLVIDGRQLIQEPDHVRIELREHGRAEQPAIATPPERAGRSD